MMRRKFAFAVAARVLAVLVPLNAFADEPMSGQFPFHGLWSDGAPCRWYNEYHWGYDRETVSIPRPRSLFPGKMCRILRTTRMGSDWVLSLSCTQYDQDGQPVDDVALTQHITVIDGGRELRVVMRPVDNERAGTIVLRWCRAIEDPEPPMLCPSGEPGGVKPCEP